MKKVRIFSILLSLSPFIITYLYSLTPWGSGLTDQMDFIDDTLACIDSTSSPAESTSLLSFATLPMLMPQVNIAPLEKLYDLDLQKELESIVNGNSHWLSLSKNKNLSIGIVDMMDPLHSRFAAVNANNMVYAASLPKIAVLLASEEAIAAGKIKETPEVRQDMRMMIAKSSNEAASRMIDRVGIKSIGEVMKDPKYNLYDQANGGGLWVGKSYGRGNGRIGDPIKNLSHAASVMQVCKYYYMLAFGQLVNPDRSREMLEMLVNPELHHKFVSVLDRVAPEAKVYRKSGTWANWHADSAMVWDTNRRYIVVVLAEDPAGESMLRELMAKIDDKLVAKG